MPTPTMTSELPLLPFWRSPKEESSVSLVSLYPVSAETPCSLSISEVFLYRLLRDAILCSSHSQMDYLWAILGGSWGSFGMTRSQNEPLEDPRVPVQSTLSAVSSAGLSRNSNHGRVKQQRKVCQEWSRCWMLIRIVCKSGTNHVRPEMIKENKIMKQIQNKSTLMKSSWKSLNVSQIDRGICDINTWKIDRGNL